VHGVDLAVEKGRHAITSSASGVRFAGGRHFTMLQM
jgi:hypothetical protein